MNQFGSLTASELYCPQCQRSQPVREKLLLVLPSGELHDFVCVGCGSSLGKRTITGPAVTPVATQQPQGKPRLLLR